MRSYMVFPPKTHTTQRHEDATRKSRCEAQHSKSLDELVRRVRYHHSRPHRHDRIGIIVIQRNT